MSNVAKKKLCELEVNMIKKRYDYLVARQLTIITGVVFVSQLIWEMGGFTRKPGFGWVIYACAGAFVLSIFYSIVLILLNVRHDK